MRRDGKAQKGNRLVSRVVNRLRVKYHPEQIVLFGSYASGRHTEDSDLDMLIIKRTRRPFFKRLYDVRTLAEPVLAGCPFDPIVLTPAELEERLTRGDQFLRSILDEGRQVYAQG
jgi:predicted nucleotidyltransferase